MIERSPHPDLLGSTTDTPFVWCVKIRLQSVSVSVSVSIIGWLQKVFPNHPSCTDGYRRPSVSVSIIGWLQKVFPNHPSCTDGYRRPSVTIQFGRKMSLDGYKRFSVTILISIICGGWLWKTFFNHLVTETDTELIQIRGVSGTRLVCTETLHVDVALKFAIALFEHN